MRTGKDSVFDWFATILAYLDKWRKIILRFREINFRRVRGRGSDWFNIRAGCRRVGNSGDLNCSIGRCLWANIMMMALLIAVGTENRISTLIYQCNGLLVVPPRLLVYLWMMCWGEIRRRMRNIYVCKETFNAMVKHAAEKILAKFKVKVTPNKMFW